jgi:prepilin-type N-terminal cleavage/methylation domain-containing protein
MKNFKKGFTLIELLVVVAIIGILASVVLASLNTARAKGQDASIKANLANMRVQMALDYDNTPGAYGTTAATACNTAGSLFVTDTTLASAIAQVTSQAGASEPNCYIDTAKATFAIAAKLKVGGTSGTYCVDSTGAGKVLTAGTTSTSSAVGSTTAADVKAVGGTAAAPGYFCN